MSRLQELIDELCPNGVEYKNLGDMCRIRTGKLNANAMVEDGEYPFFTCDAKPYRINEYAFDTSAILISGNGSQVGHLNMYEGKFNAYQRTYVLDDFMYVEKSYLFHYMAAYLKDYILVNCKKGSVPYITLPMLQNFKVSVPPQEVQCEIVRVLDFFTLLTDGLTDELTDELIARKKQYEYYREKLINNQRCKTKKLSEIVDIYLGLTATPEYVESGVKFISAQNTSGDYLDLNNVKYISEETYNKSSSNAKPQKGDLLFTRVGSNLGHPVIVDTDERLCIFVSLGYLRPKKEVEINVNYLKHWMNTDLFWAQVRKNVHGAAKVNLNTGWLKEFEIPFPYYSTQEDIVKTLDEFEVVQHKIESDIIGELELRKKQYEYYREKLLSFKELEKIE